MRVLVDAYWWHEGPPSGQLVLRNLVQNWHETFPGDELFLAVPKSNGSVGMGIPSDRVSFVETKFKLHPLINAFELQLIAKKLGNIDGIFTQNFSSYNGSTVYIHDVLFQSNPEWFSRKERLYFSLIPWLAGRARSIVTSSNTESQRIQHHNRRLPSASPTGLSISDSLTSSPAEQPGVRLAGLRFALTVGRINKRKNLARTLLSAVDSKAFTADTPLVVVGESSGKTEKFDPEVSIAAERGEILFLGYVSDSNLRWLYENCSLFCYLSLDEGYGLTPLEANYFGADCLVSDIAVFRETLDGLPARFVDPNSTDEISRAFVEMFPEVNKINSAFARNLSKSKECAVKTSWGTAVTTIRDTFIDDVKGNEL